MAKRFTDTEKWKRPWFAELSPISKLAWLYILDECESFGVWHANFRRMSFDLNHPFTSQLFEETFASKAVKIDSDKYFIPSFLAFQYGKLNPKNKVHIRVMGKVASEAQDLPLDGRCAELLKKFKEITKNGEEFQGGSLGADRPSAKGSQTLKEKEEEKDKEQEKEEHHHLSDWELFDREQRSLRDLDEAPAELVSKNKGRAAGLAESLKTGAPTTMTNDDSGEVDA